MDCSLIPNQKISYITFADDYKRNRPRLIRFGIFTLNLGFKNKNVLSKNTKIKGECYRASSLESCLLCSQAWQIP